MDSCTTDQLLLNLRKDYLDNETIKKIAHLLKSAPKELSRVLWYIGEEEKVYYNTGEPGPVNKILKMMTNGGSHFEATFENYIMQLVEDTARAEYDVDYRKEMNSFHNQMLVAAELKISEVKYLSDVGSGKITVPTSSTDHNISLGFYAGLARLSPEVLESIIHLAAESTKFSGVLTVTTKKTVLSFVRNGSASMVIMGLAAVYLALDARKSINEWWRGEISGRRCAKQIADSIICLGASLGGGIGGSALGYLLGGVVGAIAGGYIGSLMATLFLNPLAQMLTCKIFDLPKEKIVENAFAYFKLNHHATVTEVNTAYRRKSLITHPDKKGGSVERFAEVQTNMAIIKKFHGEEL